MERDPNDVTGSPTTNPGSSGSYGSGDRAASTSSPDGLATNSGTATPVRNADMPSGESRTDAMANSVEQGVDRAKDKVQEKMGDARQQFDETAERARGWKRSVEQKLADKLHDGASKLRDRANEMPNSGASKAGEPTAGAIGTPAYAGGATDGTAIAAVADRAKSVEQKVASGMDATADWLRDGDLKETVKEQARSNPVRTLLVALGVGYLLGKALKR